MPNRQSLYTGRSGQLAVMAEFVFRGYNAAIPEVDVGDDIFVVRDEDGNLSRIQVKTANAHPLKQGGFSAAFGIPYPQLVRPQTPELTYVLLVRHNDRWAEFIVISRTDLYGLHSTQEIGSLQKDQKVHLALSFRDGDVTCKGQSFQRYRSDWSRWPVIQHDEIGPGLQGESG